MTTDQQEIHLTNFFDNKMLVLKKKANDYNGEDVLRIFKLTADIENRSAAQVILSEITKKVLRLQNLLGSGKNPENESVSDSVLDLSGYTDLLHCALKEEQKQHIIECGNNLSLQEIIEKSYASLQENQYSGGDVFKKGNELLSKMFRVNSEFIDEQGNKYTITKFNDDIVWFKFIQKPVSYILPLLVFKNYLESNTCKITKY